MKGLEIGPGGASLGSEFVTVGVNGTSDHHAVWGEESLPFEDSTFDLVYASHVLEHVPWHDTIAALQEVRRVLKEGGTIEIWVPDFEKIALAYFKRECVDEWAAHNPEGDFMLSVNGRIFTRGPGLDNYHRAVFDHRHLRRCLEQAGFRNIRKLHQPRGYDHGYINLGMGGQK
jgi:predicted SAM-dependent methyltransferase